MNSSKWQYTIVWRVVVVVIVLVLVVVEVILIFMVGGWVGKEREREKLVENELVGW